MRDYSNAFGITSNTIRYLHGYGDDYLMCCTNSGVDVYKETATTYRSTYSTTGAYKCFMTSTSKFYYTLNISSTWSINRVDNALWDWTSPDCTYTNDGSILESGITINDIFITEDTSVSGSGYNTVFMATSSGVYVIDEGNLDYAIYYREDG
jgi:hypothetical protein